MMMSILIAFLTVLLLILFVAVIQRHRRTARMPHLRLIRLTDQWHVSRFLENGEPSDSYLERVGCVVVDEGDLHALTVIPPQGWWQEHEGSRTFIKDARGKTRFIEHHDAVADVSGNGLHSGSIEFSSFLVPVSP